jgi:hypothetical protein
MTCKIAGENEGYGQALLVDGKKDMPYIHHPIKLSHAFFIVCLMTS